MNIQKTFRVLFLGGAFASSVIACSACHSSSSGATATSEGGTLGGGDCSDPSTCVGFGNPCYKSVTCTDGKCAFKLQSPGFALPDASQTPFDCKYVACDNFGNVQSVPDDLDRPDAGPCMAIFCIGGEKHQAEAQPDGTPCGGSLTCTAGVCGGTISDAGHD